VEWERGSKLPASPHARVPPTPPMRTLFLLLSCALAAGTAAAQPLTLRGAVTSTDGTPLVGAHVIERGTTNGTTTDAEGRYTLRYGNPEAFVVFNYIGFQRQEIPVDGRVTLDVVLVEGVDLSELVVVGSRSYDRSVTETTVPVDVLDVAALTNTVGNVEVHQLLQYAAPAFNANRQSGADGSDHVDPASLRGLGPDQTLVLINGQRRHQSALINIFGSRGRGNTGTDLNAIPAAAIERIEILRDGASAQYGSDAIAGVINIVLKDDVDVLTGSVSGGTYEASGRDDTTFDGEQLQASANYGVPVGSGGFLNLTFDYLSKARTNRPVNAADSLAVYRRQFGDAALQNAAFFLNASAPLVGQASVYAFGGLNYRDTDAYAWTREADSDRNVPAIYPEGFDPRILSAITDRSLSAGLRTELRGWGVDFNNTYGANRFHYFVDGTLNASLLERSPTRFDAGGFELTQNTTGLGMSRFFREALQGVNVAFGAEHRIENYRIFAGEEASWRNYGIVDSLVDGTIQPVDVLGRPGGAQGFPGFRPENELDETRTNLAGYLDTEFNLTPQFLLAAAVRGEHYSDFGNTATARLAARYAVVPGFALRGSVGTGFRAPSLAQVYFNTTFTDFVSGVPVDKIIARNNSALTRTLGIEPLTEETARNASLGFTASYGSLTATIDGYYVAIDDRIVLTGAFGDDDPDIGADLQALGVGAAQFFTNALDTETYGLDVILGYALQLGGGTLRATYAGNFNHMELGDIRTSPRLAGREDIYFGPREQHFLLASAPPSKMNLTLDFLRGPVTTTARFVRFGEVTLIDWIDEEDVYDSKVTTDLSLGLRLDEALHLTVGGSNLFDVYPTQQDTETETGGMWDAVQMGFSGRFYFARLGFRL
jgi:iron complex outermembrane receptor protein